MIYLKKLLCIYAIILTLLLTSCGSDRFEKFDIMVNPMNDGALKVEYNVEVKAKSLDEKSYVDFYITDVYNGIYDNFTSLNDNCTSISIYDEEIDNGKIRYIRCDLSDEVINNEIININFTYELACLYSYKYNRITYKFYIPKECNNLYWKSRGNPEHAGGVIEGNKIHWDNDSQKLKYAFVQYEITVFPELFCHGLDIVDIIKINPNNLGDEPDRVFTIILYSLLISIPVLIIIIIIAIIIRKKTTFGIIKDRVKVKKEPKEQYASLSKGNYISGLRKRE